MLIVMIIIILTSLTFLVARQLLRIEKTESTTKFTVSYSPKVGKWMFYPPYVLVIFGLVFYIIYRFDDEAVKLFLFMFSLFAIFWLVALASFLWRLEVDQESLTYRTPSGRTKEIQASELDKVVLTDQGSLILYVNGEKLGMLSKEFLHIDNFLSYCRDRGVALRVKEGKPLTKARLYAGAMKGWFAIAIGLCVFAGVVFSILGVTTGDWIMALALGVFFVVTVPLIMLIIGSLLVLPEIFRIVAQERFFGMNFREEMKKQGITTTKHISKEWFIEVDHPKFYIFRRGYIVEVEQMNKPRETELGLPDFDMGFVNMIAIRADGKRIKIVGKAQTVDQEHSLVRLKKWIEEGFDYSEEG